MFNKKVKLLPMTSIIISLILTLTACGKDKEVNMLSKHNEDIKSEEVLPEVKAETKTEDKADNKQVVVEKKDVGNSNSKKADVKSQTIVKSAPRKSVTNTQEKKPEPSKAAPSKSTPKVPEKPKTDSLSDKIAKTKVARKTNQIILVSGSKLTFWEKSQDGTWNNKLSTTARKGYGGFTFNKREGDGATPIGVYPILYSFGVRGNPGTKIAYKRITQNSYFVDDTNSRYYNQWYEGVGEKGEHMIDYPTQYKYGMVIGYNTSHTPNKGSAIFLHCYGKGNTAGCVSVPESDMLRLMKEVRANAYIIIIKGDNAL